MKQLSPEELRDFADQVYWLIENCEDDWEERLRRLIEEAFKE